MCQRDNQIVKDNEITSAGKQTLCVCVCVPVLVCVRACVRKADEDKILFSEQLTSLHRHVTHTHTERQMHEITMSHFMLNK